MGCVERAQCCALKGAVVVGLVEAERLLRNGVDGGNECEVRIRVMPELFVQSREVMAKRATARSLAPEVVRQLSAVDSRGSGGSQQAQATDDRSSVHSPR